MKCASCAVVFAILITCSKHQEHHDCSHLPSFGFLHTRGMSGSDETSRGVGTRAPRPATIKFNPSALTKKWDSLGQRDAIQVLIGTAAHTLRAVGVCRPT